MKTFAKCILLIGTPLLIVSCTSTPPLTLTPLDSPLKAAGFILLPMTDSKMTPGSVIEVKRDSTGATSVRWLADIRKCGLKNSDLGFTQGTSGAISSDTNYSADVGATLAILSIKAQIQPQLQAAKTVTVKVDKDGADAIDLIATSAWFSDPGHIAAMPAICKTFLSQPDTYLVNEAFRISSGSYTFKDSAGAKINLSALSGQNISANAGVSAAADGSITIASDVYLAVKDVKQLSLGAFTTMGQTGPSTIPSADALLATGAVKVSQ